MVVLGRSGGEGAADRQTSRRAINQAARVSQSGVVLVFAPSRRQSSDRWISVVIGPLAFANLAAVQLARIRGDFSSGAGKEKTSSALYTSSLVMRFQSSSGHFTGDGHHGVARVMPSGALVKSGCKSCPCG